MSYAVGRRRLAVVAFGATMAAAIGPRTPPNR